MSFAAVAGMPIIPPPPILPLISTTVTLRPLTLRGSVLALASAPNWPSHRMMLASTPPAADEIASSASSVSPPAFGILKVALRIVLGLGALTHDAGAS